MNFPKFVLRLIYGKRLPTLEGEITIPGLTNPITIHRDGYGVPYIRAKSEQDAFYGLGFWTAYHAGLVFTGQPRDMSRCWKRIITRSIRRLLRELIMGSGMAAQNSRTNSPCSKLNQLHGRLQMYWPASTISGSVCHPGRRSSPA
jgi:hypothetical protein